MDVSRTTALTGVFARGLTGDLGYYYWSVIDDNQTPNWTAINDDESAGWTEVDDSQVANWNEITTV